MRPPLTLAGTSKQLTSDRLWVPGRRRQGSAACDRDRLGTTLSTRMRDGARLSGNSRLAIASR
jgi:hypothetical protein